MLTEREKNFLTIHPNVTKIVTKIISDSYPNYFKRNEEDIKSDISLLTLQFLDLFPEFSISVMSPEKLYSIVIDFVLNNILNKIKKDIIYESLKFNKTLHFSIERLMISMDFSKSLHDLISFKLKEENSDEKNFNLKIEEIVNILDSIYNGYDDSIYDNDEEEFDENDDFFVI